MKEWHIIHECDTENGTPTQWAKEINHPKYGRYVWIELTYNNTYNVVTNDTVLKNCKSLVSAKRWVSTNLQAVT